MTDAVTEQVVQSPLAWDFEEVACQLCGSPEATPLPYAYSYQGAPYRVVRCQRCGQRRPPIRGRIAP